jgi:predicted nucleic acid-binding protein
VPLYLADTSAWTRSRQVVDRWDELVEEDSLAVCAPVLLELLYSARGKADYENVAFNLEGFPTLPLNERASHVALRTQARLAARSQHRGPRPLDLVIAAIAEIHDAVLLHYDRHFDAIAHVTGQQSEWLARRGSLD